LGGDQERRTGGFWIAATHLGRVDDAPVIAVFAVLGVSRSILIFSDPADDDGAVAPALMIGARARRAPDDLTPVSGRRSRS
jgi:hypothetical protein